MLASLLATFVASTTVQFLSLFVGQQHHLKKRNASAIKFLLDWLQNIMLGITGSNMLLKTIQKTMLHCVAFFGNRAPLDR